MKTSVLRPGLPPFLSFAASVLRLPSVRSARLTLLAAGLLTSYYSASCAQPTATLTTLYNFTNGNDSSYPISALVQGTDGSFYGTTHGDGEVTSGSIFKITPAGVLTSLYVFPPAANGHSVYPNALVQGGDGSFYGTTVSSGTAGFGTVFVITPAGIFTTLYNFPGGDAGANPTGPLVSSGGNFYGTTEAEGAGGNGTVFVISPAGLLTTLYSFTNGSDGSFPGALAAGSDGNFYGTTVGDGASTFGSIFKITPAGALTTLYSFPALGNGDSVFPNALVQGTDGNFYGTTEGDESSSFGTVYQITPAGAFTTLYSFTGGGDGDGPDSIGGDLVEGSDGNFYGVTLAGGNANGDGTIFQVTPAGVLTTLYTFTGAGDGLLPFSGLAQGSDGSFYGTTNGGGANGDGTIFKLAVSGTAATFFTGQTALSNGVYYLAFPDGTPFGYYSYLSDPAYLFHFDLG